MALLMEVPLVLSLPWVARNFWKCLIFSWNLQMTHKRISQASKNNSLGICCIFYVRCIWRRGVGRMGGGHVTQNRPLKLGDGSWVLITLLFLNY